MYQQHMLRKLRKPILKYTLNKYYANWLSSFKAALSVTFDLLILELMFLFFKNTVKI